MRKIENNRCLFESNLNIAQCVLGLALTMFMSWPALWLSKDALLSYFLTWILLTVIWWSLFLRKSFFYDNYVIIFFPLRLIKRQVRIDYKEVHSFKFVDKGLDGELLELIVSDGSYIHELFVQYVYSAITISRNRHKNMRFFFFLKYLKSQGFLIETKDHEVSSTEVRINTIFGSGNLNYLKKSPGERRKARKKNIIITIIIILIGTLLGILIPPRSWR